ncbi:unnamed protein product, partial [marine sediment metagenome]
MMADWKLRTTAPELAARYKAEGSWTDETLASVLDRTLRANADLALRVWSDQRPFVGSVGRVHELARRVAAGLRASGIGPGDVVAFQIPSWVEAAATFWGIAQSGAAILPIVHFYGPREVGFILRQSGARAFVTADRFRSLDYLASLEGVRAEARELELVVTIGAPPEGAIGFDALTDHAPEGRLPEIDPAAPAVIAYTSGTTAEPKGVVHTHHSILA